MAAKSMLTTVGPHWPPVTLMAICVFHYAAIPPTADTKGNRNRSVDVAVGAALLEELCPLTRLILCNGFGNRGVDGSLVQADGA